MILFWPLKISPGNRTYSSDLHAKLLLLRILEVATWMCVSVSKCSKRAAIILLNTYFIYTSWLDSMWVIMDGFHPGYIYIIYIYIYNIYIIYVTCVTHHLQSPRNRRRVDSRPAATFAQRRLAMPKTSSEVWDDWDASCLRVHCYVFQQGAASCAICGWCAELAIPLRVIFHTHWEENPENCLGVSK